MVDCAEGVVHLYFGWISGQIRAIDRESLAGLEFHKGIVSFPVLRSHHRVGSLRSLVTDSKPSDFDIVVVGHEHDIVSDRLLEVLDVDQSDIDEVQQDDLDGLRTY